MTDNDFHWLVGILEGEGSFMAGAPSRPHAPIIAVNMTDEDVIVRISKLLAIGYRKCKYKNTNWKQAFYISLRGLRAYNLMLILKPYMGTRRQSQIERAVACYKNKSRHKINTAQANEIKKRFCNGEAAVDLAAEYGLCLGSVYDIKNGRSHLTT